MKSILFHSGKYILTKDTGWGFIFLFRYNECKIINFDYSIFSEKCYYGAEEKQETAIDKTSTTDGNQIGRQEDG